MTMEMPCNTTLLNREQQLERLLEEAHRDVARKERIIRKLSERIGRQTTEDVMREMEQEDRMKGLEAENQRLATENRELMRKLDMLAARMEEKEHARPMTIIYGNNATPMYGERIINRQNNSTNHNPKNDMKIENFTNNGEIKQLGDGNTMNVYEAQERQAATLSPSQEQMENALMRLAAGELAVGKIADTCWWGVHKFLSEYKLTDMNMAEFGVYLVNRHIQEKNIYDNFRRTGSTLTMLARLKVADWSDVDGSTTEAAQRQIDVVKCLHKELCGK